MRVFIGIKLDDRVHNDIEKFLHPFKKNSSPIRWVKPENVHVTLKFIGEVPTEKYSQIEQRLCNTPFNTGSFDLELAGCGKFGRGESLDIFWIGISPNESLKQIYHHIENSLVKIGIAKEKRPFTPHITVGRNKKTFNFNSFNHLIEEYRSQVISRLSVDHCQVFKSDLRPEGPIYTILKEIPLVQE